MNQLFSTLSSQKSYTTDKTKIDSLNSIIGNQAFLKDNTTTCNYVIQRVPTRPTADEIITEYSLEHDHGDLYKSSLIHVRTQSDVVGYRHHDYNDNCIYFYRSMPVGEALSWLQGDGIINLNSGQPWATNFEYSKSYIEGNHNIYPIMLEVYAPGFIRKAKIIGVTNGKSEGTGSAYGNVSWGIGGKNENSLSLSANMDADIQKELDLTINQAGKRKLKPNEQKHIIEVESALAQNPNREVRQKLAIGDVFKRRIQGVRVVYIHKTRYNDAMQK